MPKEGGNHLKSLKHIEHWKIIAFFAAVYDFAVVHISYFLALWLRFDCNYSSIEPRFLNAYFSFITWYAVLAVVIFHFFHMHRIMWRYASIEELTKTILGSLTASVLHIVLITALYCRMPMSYYVWGSMLQMFFVVGLRFLFRFLLFLRSHMVRKGGPGGRVMVIGAGEAGRMILRDLKTSDKVNDRAVCVIDDNPNKWNRPIEGVPIVGGRETILENVEKYHVSKIFFAVPSMPREDRKEILTICNETGCEVKMLPGMYQLVSGQVSVSELKDVAIEDLLGRESIAPDLHEVYDFINGKVVLVTGGGGSIGSELSRQVAGHNPKQLIIFDIYENNAYAIQLELRKKYPDLDLVVLIGSVRDSRRVFQVVEKYHPQIVYHAAAHKHVPLMEDSPCEAIKNNAIGTYKTAYAAMVHGCERFVLISTDKAVNPTNIMGASKRICEMIIQTFDAKIKAGRAADLPQLFTHIGEENADPDGSGEIFRAVKTEFVAVRFGNVLGSDGSVIPIFRQQIEEGGPVTVTHPDIIRYFMTVSEAVSLVMLAGTYAHGGEIFVLDMGSPVKIDTLARNMIRLSGLKPDVDIKIEYTGLRPGEKLYEEKLMAEEGLTKTDNKLIHIGQPIAFDNDEFLRELSDLMEAAYANREETIRDSVRTMVSTYHPDGAQTVVKDGKYQELTRQISFWEDNK